MTQPRTQTIEIDRGVDFAATITFDQPVSAFSTMRFTIRETWALGETDNTGAVLSVLLTPSGTRTALLEITKEQALALQLNHYVHDVKVVTAVGGKTYMTQRGPVSVGPDVTR